MGRSPRYPHSFTELTLTLTLSPSGPRASDHRREITAQAGDEAMFSTPSSSGKATVEGAPPGSPQRHSMSPSGWEMFSLHNSGPKDSKASQHDSHLHRFSLHPGNDTSLRLNTNLLYPTEFSPVPGVLLQSETSH